MKIIKELREAHNISQTALAERLKIAQNTLSQYESGARQVPDSVKLSIAKIFDVPVDLLVGNGIFADEKRKFVLENLDLFLDTLRNLKLQGFSCSMDEYVAKIEEAEPYRKLCLISVFVKDIAVDGNNVSVSLTVK